MKGSLPSGERLELMEQWRLGADDTPDPRAIPPDGDAQLAEPAHAYFIAQATPHVPVVQRAAATLVGMADAEDAVQEAMIRAWQAAPTLHGIAAVRPWLLRITINVCRDWHRGRFGTRQRLTESLPTEERDEAFAAIGAGPGNSDHTGALDLRRAVNTLERDLRCVVALRYYAGLDATEIGVALGIPPATVRTRLRRALGILRDRLSTPSGRAITGNREGGRS